MKQTQTIAMLAVIALPTSAVSFVPEITKVTDRPVKVDVAPVKIGRSSSMRTDVKTNDSSTPLFTADVPGALAPVWIENFDNGSLKNWTKDDAQNVSWTVKAISGDKSFDAIDPDNLNSLYVEGPYQIHKREISSLTSNDFTVPFNGSFNAYVGYTLNFDDVCRLIISISTDDFETSTDIWNSKDGEGSAAWAWRTVKADLSQWAGKRAKIRLTYSWGSKDETFKTGGYMGDFIIDGLKIAGLSAIDNVSLKTGEKLRLVSLVPDAASYRWTLPDAIPPESAEANPEVYYTKGGSYDVSLEVTDKDGSSHTYTAPAFVTVAGTAPAAKILPPATFSYVDDKLEYPYMVSPLAPVTFKDASSGFPTERSWIFKGLTEGDATNVEERSEETPTVNYMYQHNWPVGLTVSNDNGMSTDFVTVAAEYEGAITNWKQGDIATIFDMGDWGTFPGSNTHKITRYAERFSAPSRPALVGGAYVYFVKAPAAVEITDNTTITVNLYTSENGLPGKRLDFDLCDVIDLARPTSDGSVRGTWFEFPELPAVSDEFFIVIDGLPAPHDDFEGVAFGMASWRADGNTALLEVDGEWKEANNYFGADKCTSYLVRPVIRHSVITSLPVNDDEITFCKEGGEKTHTIFSYMGRKDKVEADADWCRITSEPGEYTVDELNIVCDPNPTSGDRIAHLTISDGVCSHVLTIKQLSSSQISHTQADDVPVAVFPTIFTDSFTVSFPAGCTKMQIIDLNGYPVISKDLAATDTSATIDGSHLSQGFYIVLIDDTPVKVARR